MGSPWKSLAKRLMYQVPIESGFAAPDATGGGGGEGPTLNAPVFTSYKTVTFPALTVFISGVWGGLRLLGPSMAALWVPFSLSLLMGGLLTILELSEDQVTPKARKLFGFLMGLGNCIVLFAAVVGGTSLATGTIPAPAPAVAPAPVVAPAP